MEDWKKHIDVNGNFQLANFIYKSINDLMKNTLDMGTLLSDDNYKLRAYKEQVKKNFKSKWLDIANSLEFFDVIERCICTDNPKDVYCEICKGSRYKISDYLTADQVREFGTFYGAADTVEISEKLQKGLLKALNELPEMR